MAVLTHEGRGVSQNTDRAVQWLSLAVHSRTGSAPARANRLYQKLTGNRGQAEQDRLRTFARNWRTKSEPDAL